MEQRWVEIDGAVIDVNAFVGFGVSQDKDRRYIAAYRRDFHADYPVQVSPSYPTEEKARGELSMIIKALA